MSTDDLTTARRQAIRERCEQATKGPWDVWPGPEYVGGGADLCIGAGEKWLANMAAAAACQNYPHHIGCHDEGCKLEDTGDVCSLSDDITAEQRATAEFIARARQDVPDLLAALETAEATIAEKDKQIAGLHVLLADIDSVCSLDSEPQRPLGLPALGDIRHFPTNRPMIWQTQGCRPPLYVVRFSAVQDLFAALSISRRLDIPLL